MKWWFVFSFLISFSSFGQESLLKVLVKEKSDDSPIENVEVTLSLVDSIINKSYTDENGKVTFAIESDTTLIYTVSFHQKGFYDTPPATFSPGVINGERAIVLLEVSLHPDKNSNPLALSACYGRKEFKTFSEFSDSHLIELLKEYPDLCLEYIYSERPGESKHLRKKRLRHFRIHINKILDDPSNVQFSEESLKNQSFCQGCFQGRVVSMDGCN